MRWGGARWGAVGRGLLGRCGGRGCGGRFGTPLRTVGVGLVWSRV